MEKLKICHVVTNDVVNDPRVDKIARSLSKKYDVTVLGLGEKGQIDHRDKPYKVIITPKKSSIKKKQLNDSIKNALKSKKQNNIIKKCLLDFAYYYTRKKYWHDMENILKNIVADVFVSNDLDTLKICAKAAKIHNAKLIYDSHEFWIEQNITSTSIFKKLYMLEESNNIIKADAVMTVNDSIALKLKERYNLRRIPYVIYNIPNSIRNKSIETHSIINIIFCGRYEEGRGLEELINAMKFVPEQYKLFLQGYGSIEESLKELVKSLNLESKVEFLPPVEMEKIVSSMFNFDIGIIPYKPVHLCNYYCTPNKIFEYMHAGLGILASDLPELKKIIINNKLGFVFNPNNPDDIALAITKINKDNLMELKSNSLKSSEIFSWKNEEKKLFSIYDEVSNGII